MNENIFVFAVCGADKHIETLNTSIRLLRRFSRHPVLVVTDPSRNRKAIEHSDLVNVETPADMDNRRAAILLKTSLARILPLEGKTYCYLDSDVLALAPDADRVFGFHRNPVDFASDHCVFREFSPWAANCGCLERMQEETGRLDRSILKHWPYPLSRVEIQKKQTELAGLVARWEASRLGDPALAEKKQKLDRLTERFEKNREILAREVPAPVLRRIERLVYLRKVLAALLRSRLWPFAVRQAAVSALFRAGAGLYIRNGVSYAGGETWRDASGKPIYNVSEDDFQSFYLKNGPFFWDGRCWRDDEENVLYDDCKDNFGRFMAEGEGYSYDRGKRRWLDSRGSVVYDAAFEEYYRSVEEETEFRYDVKAKKWRNPQGEDVYYCECTHLADLIEQRFGIRIPDDRWPHANGGMFLFSERSKPFMETWREYTLAILDDPKWRVRDQGTLAAAFWKHGLQNAERVPEAYNFIADYYKTTVSYQGGLRFRVLPDLREVAPHLLHVYHHYGDSDWEVWKDVEALLSGQA
ncbi:MAG: hypothetical protein AB1921_00440 [Thermodesulfobacteriota bacterium]